MLTRVPERRGAALGHFQTRSSERSAREPGRELPEATRQGASDRTRYPVREDGRRIALEHDEMYSGVRGCANLVPKLAQHTHDRAYLPSPWGAWVAEGDGEAVT